MKLFIARHTQTNYNVAGLCNDDPMVDVHLTELGIQQAKKLADKLKDQQFEMIITSTLPRTRQTADIINVFHSMPMQRDARISDNKTGFEGRPVNDYFQARDSATDKWAYKAEGAESLNEIAARVQAFLEDLKAKSYEAVLIVTHQSIMRQICVILDGLDRMKIEEFDVPQGEYIKLIL